MSILYLTLVGYLTNKASNENYMALMGIVFVIGVIFGFLDYLYIKYILRCSAIGIAHHTSLQIIYIVLLLFVPIYQLFSSYTIDSFIFSMVFVLPGMIFIPNGLLLKSDHKN